MKKICIINVYFGKYPNYFHLWLHSAKMNPTIDFLLVTDQQLQDLPENVRTLSMNLEQFSKLASEKIGLEIHVPNPYKICDFKVTYGLVFEDYLKDYDFWGHCDVDLIWGDLRKFFPDELLDKYDRILKWGHLSLYKNTPDAVKYFMLDGCKRGSYKEVLQSKKHYAFDESTGVTSIFDKNNLSQYDGNIIAGIDVKYKRFALNNKQRDAKKQVFYYNDGHVYRAYSDDGKILTDEFAYIHLHKRKFNNENTLKSFDGGQFYITYKGFIKKPENDIITNRTIQKLNPYYGQLYEEYEQKLRRLHEIVEERENYKDTASKNYKYIHICYQSESKFLTSLISQFQSMGEEAFSQHLFVTKYIPLKDRFYDSDNVIVDNRKWYKIINDYGKNAKYIILHSMIRPASQLLFVHNSIAKKTVWRLWGHDIRPMLSENGLKKYIAKLPNAIYRNKVRKFYAFGLGSICDKFEYEKYFGAMRSFVLTYKSDERSLAVSSTHKTERANEDPITILVGHCGLSYVNHIEIIDALSKFADENIKIIFPLSYGVEDYINKVKQKALSAFGNKAVFLTDFMDYKEYVQLLSKIDIAAFGHSTSAAIGNLHLLAYFGAKLYVRKDSAISKEFDYLGYGYKLVDEINQMSFDEFSEPLASASAGREIFHSVADTQAFNKSWGNLVD